jgi:high affinity sulfate transporter 1
LRVPLFEGLGPAERRRIGRDVWAGISLATMNIPQVMGYTRIAGTPVVTGLYTLLLPAVAFAVFGSSRHLVVAADSATAAIFASSLAPMATAGGAQYMALVGIVALLTSALLFIARLLKLGFFADFLSRTVLVGFLTGVGVQVGIAVLGDLLGIETQNRRTVPRLVEIALHLGTVHLSTLALSAAVVGSILASRRWLPRLPVPLIAVVGAIAASVAFDFAGRGIAVIGPIAGGLPSLSLPTASWSAVVALIPVAGSCFLIIVAQSAATARAMATPHHERVDENADILGLAAANAAAAMSGAFVVNGSPTQSAMGERAGATTQVAQLATAAVVVAVLLLLTGPLEYLPRCVLAAIVFTIAVGMIDIDALIDIRRESPGEFTLALVTAAAVALVGVEQGILLAVGLSLARHVRHSYRPHSSVLAPDASGRWVPQTAVAGRETEPGLIVYRFGADLFYANEARFTDEVRSLVKHAPVPVRWLVVDAGAITDVDYSAARSVRELCDDLTRQGVGLVFARVRPYLRSDMDRHGITNVIGAEHVFETLHEGLDFVRGTPARDLPQEQGQ